MYKEAIIFSWRGCRLFVGGGARIFGGGLRGGGFISSKRGARIFLRPKRERPGFFPCLWRDFLWLISRERVRSIPLHRGGAKTFSCPLRGSQKKLTIADQRQTVPLSVRNDSSLMVQSYMGPIHLVKGVANTFIFSFWLSFANPFYHNVQWTRCDTFHPQSLW